MSTCSQKGILREEGRMMNTPAGCYFAFFWLLQSLFSSCILRRLFTPETVVSHHEIRQFCCVGSAWNLAILGSNPRTEEVLGPALWPQNPCSTTGGLQDLKGLFNINDFVIFQVAAGDLSTLSLLREAHCQEGKSQKFWLGLSFLTPASHWALCWWWGMRNSLRAEQPLRWQDQTIPFETIF